MYNECESVSWSFYCITFDTKTIFTLMPQFYLHRYWSVTLEQCLPTDALLTKRHTSVNGTHTYLLFMLPSIALPLQRNHLHVNIVSIYHDFHMRCWLLHFACFLNLCREASFIFIYLNLCQCGVVHYILFTLMSRYGSLIQKMCLGWTCMYLDTTFLY